jgi:hypothetical protein
MAEPTIEIAFFEGDECFKFASEGQEVNGFYFIRGHNVTFNNDCNELDTIISDADPFTDYYNIFGGVEKKLLSFDLTLEQCSLFQLIAY